MNHNRLRIPCRGAEFADGTRFEISFFGAKAPDENVILLTFIRDVPRDKQTAFTNQALVCTGSIAVEPSADQPPDWLFECAAQWFWLHREYNGCTFRGSYDGDDGVGVETQGPVFGFRVPDE